MSQIPKREDFRKERMPAIVGCCCRLGETWIVPHSLPANSLQIHVCQTWPYTFPQLVPVLLYPSIKVRDAVCCFVHGSHVCHSAEGRMHWGDPALLSHQYSTEPTAHLHCQPITAASPLSSWDLLVEITDSVFITLNFQHVALCPRHNRYSIKITLEGAF